MIGHVPTVEERVNKAERAIRLAQAALLSSDRWKNMGLLDEDLHTAMFELLGETAQSVYEITFTPPRVLNTPAPDEDQRFEQQGRPS